MKPKISGLRELVRVRPHGVVDAPEISMMATTAPAGVRSGIAR
jgi:hypothetical protein